MFSPTIIFIWNVAILQNNESVQNIMLILAFILLVFQSEEETSAVAEKEAVEKNLKQIVM